MRLNPGRRGVAFRLGVARRGSLGTRGSFAFRRGLTFGLGLARRGGLGTRGCSAFRRGLGLRLNSGTAVWLWRRFGAGLRVRLRAPSRLDLRRAAWRGCPVGGRLGSPLRRLFHSVRLAHLARIGRQAGAVGWLGGAPGLIFASGQGLAGYRFAGGGEFRRRFAGCELLGQGLIALEIKIPAFVDFSWLGVKKPHPCA